MLIGGDTGEGQAGNGHNHSVQLPSGGTERCVVRLVVDRNSTLLGPERTTDGLSVADARGLVDFQSQAQSGFPYLPHCVCGVWWIADRVVGWLLVENCTVDASILFSVVKLSRANGGCLGTRSR